MTPQQSFEADEQRGRRDPLADDFQLGDPVIDLANGRNMVIIDQAAESVTEWNEHNDYDLLGNTGNSRLRVGEGDPVFTCVYVTGVDSQPSKTYDFPSSRLGRAEYENAADATVYELVTRDVFRRLFAAALPEEETEADWLEGMASYRGEFDESLVAEARELAEVDEQFGGGDE
jgi:hypothetical protein